jgi:hypothetical protein
MNEKRLHILASPGFLIGLFLLLLNDFIFKYQFHNELTGKLSDFAGLFVFPLFWVAFFPRLKSPLYILTAILFIFWKSAYSQPLIDAWNSLPLFMIERTVDYSDLLALLVLPLSYVYSRATFDFQLPLRALYMIAMISLFAFTATQFSNRIDYNKEYLFQASKRELLDRMSRLPVNDVNRPSSREILSRFALIPVQVNLR